VSRDPQNRREMLVVTRDGWRLRLERFTPHVYSDRTPVLCVHGHATTGWTWRGGPGGGLVGALVDAGREVWTVDLRGSTGSLPPRRGAPVRIADKIGVDLPAVLGHVLAHAGTERLDLVGHSLGGVMIYLLGLSGHPLAPRVRRVVTVGSPLSAPGAKVPSALLGRAASAVVGRVRRLPVCGLAARLGRHAPRGAFPTHFAPGALDERAFEGFMRHGVSDVYGPELVELAAWLREGDARTLLPGLSTGRPPTRLPFPTRYIVGADDGVTTADSVTATQLVLGGDLQVLPGYRHADILIGRRIREDVAPLVVSWLAAGRRNTPATRWSALRRRHADVVVRHAAPLVAADG